MKKFGLICLLALPLSLACSESARAGEFKIGFGVGVGVGFNHGCLSLSVYGWPICEGNCNYGGSFWSHPCATYGWPGNAFGQPCATGYCSQPAGDYISYGPATTAPAPAQTPDHVYYAPTHYPVGYYQGGYGYTVPAYWYGR